MATRQHLFSQDGKIFLKEAKESRIRHVVGISGERFPRPLKGLVVAEALLSPPWASAQFKACRGGLGTVTAGLDPTRHVLSKHLTSVAALVAT